MARTTPARSPGFRCAECGWTTVKWVGRCGECQAWGTVDEVGGAALRAVAPGPVSGEARPIAHVDIHVARATPTGIGELDRVLGGGLVPGAVILLAGEPGIGKSTLLLEMASAASESIGPALYVSGEESAAQIRLRAERVGALAPALLVAAETDLAAVLGQIESVNPGLVIIDSVQTISHPAIEGQPGGVAQVREVAAALIRTAKQRAIPMVLVGHVTKDGSIAGPRLLEHLVDVVLSVEGERHARLRLLRALKNRYGPADEVGCFELSDTGIIEVTDPSALFLSQRPEPVPGTCVTVTLEGSRPLLTEVQALVVPSSAGTPRRSTSGLDSARVAMVHAVLQRRVGLTDLDRAETFVATVGGVKVGEPAADLAVAIALTGGLLDRPLAPRTIAVGEVGLAGEVRRVSSISRRLAEAARLGFTHAVVPRDPGPVPAGLRVLEVDDVRQVIDVLARDRSE